MMRSAARLWASLSLALGLFLTPALAQWAGPVAPAHYGPPAYGAPGMYDAMPVGHFAGGHFGGGCGDCGGGCGHGCGGLLGGGLTRGLGCGYCSGYGCDACGGMGHGYTHLGPVGRFFDWLLTKHGPEGDAVFCRPRWFDVQFEVVNLRRDQTTGEPRAFTSAAVIPGNPALTDPRVLTTGDLTFNEDLGWRIVGSYPLGPGTNIEIGYVGGFVWNERATVDSTDVSGQPFNLYSVFSEFGTNPNNQFQIGFPETDAAQTATISYNTKLDSGELSIRRRWVRPHCLWHSSFFLGARYVRLDEEFRHDTFTNDGSMAYNVRTENDMAGFQIGGDIVLNMTKRIRVGGDLKAGIYGNRSSQKTVILLDGPNPGVFRETADKAEAAFVGEAALYVLYYLTDRWTMRAGYNVIYLNNVALAPENFNDDVTFFTGSRTAIINNTGDAFYHGLTAGFEFTW